MKSISIPLSWVCPVANSAAAVHLFRARLQSDTWTGRYVQAQLCSCTCYQSQLPLFAWRLLEICLQASTTNCTCLCSRTRYQSCKVSKTYWCMFGNQADRCICQMIAAHSHFVLPHMSGRQTGYTSATEHIRLHMMPILLNHSTLNARSCQLVPMTDWISDTCYQGCTNSQNLVCQQVLVVIQSKRWLLWVQAALKSYKPAALQMKALIKCHDAMLTEKADMNVPYAKASNNSRCSIIHIVQPHDGSPWCSCDCGGQTT